jgi:DNA-binding CsgD family transcriptional regulator
MDSSDQFSKRELDVIELLLQGKSNKQIAFILHLTPRTIEYHLTNIYNKLGVGSRSEAVLKLTQSNLRLSANENEEIIRISTIELHDNSSNNQDKQITSWRKNMKKYIAIFSLLILIALIYIVLRVVQSPSVNLSEHNTQPTTSINPILSASTQTENVIIPTSTLISENILTPTITLLPTIISPQFPGENIYLPPSPLKFGAWPATAGCPNPEGLEDYAGLLPEIALDTLQHFASSIKETKMQWSDPAYWPVLINPFDDQTITQDWIKEITPVSESTYAQLVTSQCGEEIMKLSWLVQVCPGPCQSSDGALAIISNVFMINRMQWLIWAIQ